MDSFPGMDLNKTKGITVASSESIRDLLAAIVEETGKRRKYLGRAVTSQAIVNGLILWLGGMDPKRRAAHVDAALKCVGDAQVGDITEDQVEDATKLIKESSTGGIRLGGFSPAYFTPAVDQSGGSHALREEEAGGPAAEPPKRGLARSYLNRNNVDLGDVVPGAGAAKPGGGGGDGLDGDERAVRKKGRAPRGK